MSLTCEISGAVPTDPVVTPEGHLYERHLIEEHLARSATCPVTGNALSKKSLIPLKQKAIKRPSSVLLGNPQDLLNALQKHIDNQAAENLRLYKERDEARMQVTSLLYIRDGSTRVVAQKMEEIALLRRQLDELRSQPAAADGTEPAAKKAKVATDTATIIARWNELQKSLLVARKQRKPQFRHADILKEECKESESYSLPGLESITAFELAVSGMISPIQPKQPAIVILGTNSGRLHLLNWQTKTILATLTGHEGPITAIKCLLFPCATHLAPASLAALRASSSSPAPFKSALVILSAGEDGTVRYWKDEQHVSLDDWTWLVEAPTAEGNGRFVDLKHPDLLPTEFKMSCEHVFRLGEGPVTDMRFHPAGTHIGVCTGGATWTMIDIPNCAVYQKLDGLKEDQQLRLLAFQPDGLVAVGATQQNLGVWDLRENLLKAEPSVPPTVQGDITALDFSENGFTLVLATSKGAVAIYDLRKTLVVQELDLGSAAHQAKFDRSGKHLLVATDSGIRLYSQVDKRTFDLLVQYQGKGGFRAVSFDKLSDDFYLALSDQGVLTNYQCQIVSEMS